MAVVKFIRKNNHPAIEVIGASNAERAAMQEFFETFVDARYKANFVWEFDGKERGVFGWKSTIRLSILTGAGYASASRIILTNKATLTDVLTAACRGTGTKLVSLDSSVAKYRELDETNGYAALIIDYSCMNVYELNVVDEVLQTLVLHNSIDIYQLKELEKKYQLRN